MSWRIAETEQSLLRAVHAARRQQRLRSSLASGAAKVRQACEEEGYVFELSEREDRPNPFADALVDLTQ